MSLKQSDLAPVFSFLIPPLTALLLLLTPVFGAWPCHATTEPPPGGEAAAPGGLAAALQAVISHNPAVKGARAELKAQGHAIDSAKAARYPTLSAQANNVNDPSGRYDQGTLRLQQPLWAFGKIDTAIDRQKANYGAEQWNLLQVQRQLIESTAAAYAKAEGALRRAEVARVNIAEHDRLYQRIKRRHSGGLASEADERLAYSRLIQARAQAVGIEGELQVALTELHSLTHVPVPVDRPVERALAELPAASAVEELALKKSADVRYKQKRLKVVALDVKGEKVATLPNIYYRVDHEFLDKPSSGERTSSGLVIEGNFEGLGFSALGRVKGAVARQVVAREELNEARNDVRSLVNALMISRNTQNLLAESQHESVEVLESTMASFLRQYESGRKTWIDVLNTQRELTVSRLQLAQIENDWLVLSLRVVALTGGLDRLAGIESI